MLIQVLLVGATALASVTASPDAIFGAVRPATQGKEESRVYLKQNYRSNMDYFSELQAIQRHERQIRFKGSYQELPKGIPKPTSHQNYISEDGFHSYYIKVDAKEPAIRNTLSTIPKLSSIYFPPEVTQADVKESSRHNIGGPGDFFITSSRNKNLGKSSSIEQISHDKPNRVLIDILPFYIPSQDPNPDAALLSTTEESVFLARDFCKDLSHQTNVQSHAQTIGIEANNHQVTPLPPTPSLVPPNPSFLSPPSAPLPPSPPPKTKASSESEKLFLTKVDSPEIKKMSKASFSQQVDEDALHTLPEKTRSVDQIPDSTTPISAFFEFDTPFFITNDNIQNKLSAPDITSVNKSPKNPNIHSVSISQPKKMTKTVPISNVYSPSNKNKGRGLKRQSKQVSSFGKTKDARGLKNINQTAPQNLPTKKFDCSTKAFGGYYSDPQTNCQVFHICLGKRSAIFHCPQGTLFNQKLLVCDWWYNVDC